MSYFILLMKSISNLSIENKKARRTAGLVSVVKM